MSPCMRHAYLEAAKSLNAVSYVLISNLIDRSYDYENYVWAVQLPKVSSSSPYSDCLLHMILINAQTLCPTH